VFSEVFMKILYTVLTLVSGDFLASNAAR